MTDFERDGVDALIARAMQGRAVPGVRGELAAKVLARVRAADLVAARLARVGRWMRWSSLAAGLLVALVIAGGVYMSGSGTTAANTTTSPVDASTDATTAEATVDWWLIGLGVLGVAVVGVAVRGVVEPPRRPGQGELGWT